MMLRRFLFLLFMVCLAHISRANVPAVSKPLPKRPLVLKADSTKVAVRHLDNKAIEAYSRHPDFQYHDDETTTPSWWNRFWHWFWNLFKFHLSKSKKGSLNTIYLILYYLLLAAGLAAIVFLVLKLIGIDVLGVFRRKPASANLPYTESLENIHDIDFDVEIEAAVTKHNYRLAVRMLYLKCLKRLSDADLIKWQIDKTNHTYIDELTNAEQKRVFRSLTDQFEYVWYGEFVIDAQLFKSINALFQDFNKGIIV